MGSLVPDAVSDNTTINITVQPATKDVFVTRNDILEIDMAKVTVTGLTDNEARSTSTSSTSTSSASTTATSGY